MLTSPDHVTQELMKKIEVKQARNLDIEDKERESRCTTGFLDWNPTYDQLEVNADVHI
jgi:hypothetical protein